MIIPFLLVVLAVLAYRFGHDSSHHLRSHEEDFARAGFTFDNETISVSLDAALPGASSATRSGGYVVATRLS